jgi:DNA helicase-2/ATP-dependent DNA helicase PcrA
MNTVTPVDLTASQRPAYEAHQPRVLVLGGPGTGKTAVALLMSRRILEALPPQQPKRVLFLTFSRSATTELAKRAPNVLAGELGTRIEISTFHAFCMNMLNGFRRFAGGSLEPLTILTREEEKLGLAPPGALTFDAIVPAALELLRTASWLANSYRERYAAVICDEFQDTTAPAAELLEELAAEAQLVCLADADQVIFDWTDPTIARRLAEYQASGATVYDLGYDSRRDTSNVIPRAATAIRERDYASSAISEACLSDRLRIVQCGALDDSFDVLVDLIRQAQSEGASQLGVFLATNSSVNEFAERLRAEAMEHEIIGLSGAAGEAQLAIAACARFVVGEGEWDEFLTALGVFVASCYRGTPPDLAFGLVRDRDLLEPGLMALLDAERDAFLTLAGKPLESFLGRAESLWRRLFVGRPLQLWELGARDFRGQTLGLRGRPMDRVISAAVTRLAHARRSVAWVDELNWPRAPISLMNVYQVKGREMDEVLLVHLPDDSDQWSPDGMRRLRRVHYVSMSRARHRVTLVLPPAPKPFFAPYAALCAAF